MGNFLGGFTKLCTVIFVFLVLVAVLSVLGVFQNHLIQPGM